MASTRDKVVKITDIYSEDSDDGLSPITRELTQFSVPFETKSSFGPTPSKTLRQSTASTGGLKTLDDEGEDSGIDGESVAASDFDDGSRSMPSGWPRLKKVDELRKIKLSSATATNVNKAAAHLELLQNAIEDWFDERASLASREQKRAKESAPTPITRKTLKFELGTEITNLEIVGVGGTSDKDKESRKGPDRFYDDGVPYLGAEDVLDEVITLLAMLEADRVDKEEECKRQRQRVRHLGQRIDDLTIQRMIELPASVQKEHEACSRDIFELQWHVSYRGRHEARIKHKTNVSKTLNKKLKADIEFVKKHVPLVSEKLNLELEAMGKIQEAQEETAKELDETRSRCAEVTQKSDDAHVKADEERKMMKLEIDSATDDLHRIQKELADARALNASLLNQIHQAENDIADNRNSIKELEEKNEKARIADGKQAKKVEDAEYKIVMQEKEKKKIHAGNMALMKEMEEKLKVIKSKDDDYLKRIDRKNEEYKFVARISKEFDLDITDLKRKIQDNADQKIADERNIERMNKSMKQSEDQLKLTMNEFLKIEAVYLATRDKLSAEEERCLQLEDQLRATCDALKKQVKDEIHARTVLQARITSDGDDLVKSKAEYRNKRDKLKKLLAEIEAAVAKVTEKVEKLRAINSDKAAPAPNISVGQKHKKLDDTLNEIRDKHKEVNKRLNARINEINPHLNHLRNDDTTLTKKIDHIDWRTEMMEQKRVDMVKSLAMMNKIIRETKKAIRELTADIEELNIKIDQGLKREDDTKAAVNQMASRTQSYEEAHRRLMREREGVYEKHENSYEENKILNRDLAAEYRELQNQFLILKDEQLNHFESRLQLETSLRDLRKLQSLQVKMHSALSEYFKYRNMYNESELARMDIEADDNSGKVELLQHAMSNALEEISIFLNKQTELNNSRKATRQSMRSQKMKGEYKSEISRSTTQLTV